MHKIVIYTFVMILLHMGYAHAVPKEVELHERSEDHVRFLEAARSGDVTAQERLGFIYKRGEEGVASDEVQAVYWFTRAAEQGSV